MGEDVRFFLNCDLTLKFSLIPYAGSDSVVTLRKAETCIISRHKSYKAVLKRARGLELLSAPSS